MFWNWISCFNWIQYILPVFKYVNYVCKYVCLNLRGLIQNFRTGRLDLELQMVHLSAVRCSCIAILWVSLVSFAAVTLCVASQRVYNVVSVHFLIDSVRKIWIHPRIFSDSWRNERTLPVVTTWIFITSHSILLNVLS